MKEEGGDIWDLGEVLGMIRSNDRGVVKSLEKKVERGEMRVSI